VASLTGTVARVEQNQTHQAELNKLRFDALDTGLNALRADLTGFMKRIDGMIDGTIETTQTREGRAMVEDYRRWRDGVDEFITTTRTIGNVTRILVGGQALTIIVAIAALVKP
jgi:ATP phosphoribosyltransferase regulatory subunit HisZ